MLKHIRISLLAALAALVSVAAYAAPAQSPQGIFGGAPAFGNLPGNLYISITASAASSASATLTVAWPYTATSELVVWPNGESRTVTFTNASTSISWTGNLTAAATGTTLVVDGLTSPPGLGTAGFTSDFGEVLSTGTYWTWSGFQDVNPVAPAAANITGCGTVTSVAGGATAGTFKAAQTSCVPVITLPYSPNGWYCSAWDITTNTDTLKQSADSTTSCTMTGTVASSDVIVWQARGF